MPNHNGNSGNGAPFHSDGTHQEEAGEQDANMTPEMLEMFALADLAPAEAEALVKAEHDNWKSTKTLDDIIGIDTDKWTKRFCVAEVAAYHKSVKFAENKPNAEAIIELALRTALSGLSRLIPGIPREKLGQLLNHKPEELEDP